MAASENTRPLAASIQWPDMAFARCKVLAASQEGVTIQLEEAIDLKASEYNSNAEITIDELDNVKVNATASQISLPILKMVFAKNPDSAITQLLAAFNNTSNVRKFAIPPTETAIIEELTELTLKNIGDLFHVFLQETDSQLFSLAEKSTSNEEQSKLFETKSILKNHGNDLLETYSDILAKKIRNNSQKTASSSEHSQSLNNDIELVDLEEFEDWLSQDSIIKRASKHHYKSISCLEKRYSKILGREISGNQLPVSIDNLTHSLQQTLKQHEINSDILPAIYRQFDTTVINRLDVLFDTLNRKLKSYGVLPNIESKILSERRRVVKAPFTDSPTTENTTSDDANVDSSELTNNPKLFDTVKSLMNLVHGSQASDTQASQEEQHFINPEQLLEQLSSLQQDHNTLNDIAGQSSLSDWLRNNQELSLSAENTELIALVDSVFRSIDQYPQVPASMATTIRQLEVPIAKAALLDDSLFTSTNHPVTLLLNQLINLCLRTDMPNATLEKKLESVIKNITENFGENTDIFSKASAELSATENQQKTAYNRNTARVAQIYDGRQQVQNAKNRVEKEIHRRVSAPEAPDVVIDLVDNGWRELLNLNYIKEGENSDSWNDNIAILDQLQLWITGHENDEQQGQSTLERELEADSFADLIGQKLNDIFPADFRYQSTVEKIRETLKGTEPVNMVHLSEDAAPKISTHSELQKELEDANPHLVRWIKQTKNFKPGDEFTYLDDETGQRNIKLAWVSDNKQHYVFVNNQGKKVFDFDLIDLANELSKGLSLVENAEDWPLVEKSLYSTVQEAYEKLAFKSSHDELTGLISRKECDRLLNNALSEAKNNIQNHCMLYLDIDKFSLTNNLHGHLAGDQLLVDFSRVLTESTEKDTLVARIAGNEFVVLLSNHDISEGHKVASSIREAIEAEDFFWEERSVQLTTSIGLITINKYTENVVDLLRNVTTACQDAKRHGGNRVQEFRQDEKLHQRREKLLGWIDQLGNILDSGRMVLRGQKITATDPKDDHEHYEILLAIKDDNGNLDSPVEFIEAAECYNRMQRVDRWVVENTFKWLGELKAENLTMPKVSINLSGNSINDDQFVDFILEQFALYKVPTNIICFEVTETATINNISEAADFIRNVKKIGCKFSLDDFGSGNASYQYLKHLPVDYLKIDGMFVKDIDKNTDDYALVKSINDIGHLMGKKTIAEFAETEDIIDILKEINVDYMQGYALSMPTPLNEITRRLKTQEKTA